ncbi:hypothetical protein Mkiyose1665_59810 [Mycobacterium kiyosense]|nr:hypothetical protein SRL2020448_60290 [Mycobacterium kiyosense]GLD45481.1 hypothetical protein Mkiyose1665_59810 [Mycobacterium kiyosense]
MADDQRDVGLIDLPAPLDVLSFPERPRFVGSMRNHRRMHVFTTPTGELAALVGPICETPGCACAGWAALDSAQPVDTAIVTERADLTCEHLETAVTDFLQRTGWAKVDPHLAAELARDTAAEIVEFAAEYPAGTRLRVSFDHATDEWAFTRVEATLN